MDADLNTEYYADQDQVERSNLLEQILSEDNAANVLQYPQKSYAERIVLDDISYDYVIIAREDRDGVIICYEDVTTDDEDMSEFSLNSLLSGDSFRNNAIIVVTDGKTGSVFQCERAGWSDDGEMSGCEYRRRRGK